MPSCKPQNKLHVPVALNIEGEFLAAVIAAQSTGWPKLLLGARNMRKSTGAHHNPPGERTTMLDFRLEVRQPAAVFSDRNRS
jgi:hypothetical protein